MEFHFCFGGIFNKNLLQQRIKKVNCFTGSGSKRKIVRTMIYYAYETNMLNVYSRSVVNVLKIKNFIFKLLILQIIYLSIIFWINLEPIIFINFYPPDKNSKFISTEK